MNHDVDPKQCQRDMWIEHQVTHMEEGEWRWHSILALVPVRSNDKNDGTFAWARKRVRIAWTMVMIADSTGFREGWVSQDHLSTLKTCAVPSNGAEFLEHLIQYIEKAWLDICDSIDDHLSYSVSLTRFEPNLQNLLTLFSVSISFICSVVRLRKRTYKTLRWLHAFWTTPTLGSSCVANSTISS